MGACITAVGNVESASAASSRILHFSVNGDYFAEVVFASRYAERLLMNVLLKRQRAQLMQERASWLGELAYASFVGAAFEKMFHNMMKMESGWNLEGRDRETKDAKPFMQHFKKCVIHHHMFLDKAAMKLSTTS